MDWALILVVTDDETARETLQAILGDAYTLIAARTIREMLDALQDKPIDIVIVDAEVQGQGISEFLPDIFERSEFAPLLIMSESPGSEPVMNALRAGAHDTISKPLDKSDVMLKLERTKKYAGLVRERELLRKRGTTTCHSTDSGTTEAREKLPSSHSSRLLGKLAEAVATASVKELVEKILGIVSEFFMTKHAALVLLSEDASTLSAKASIGLEEDFLNQIKFSMSEGIYSWLWRNSRVLLTEEVREPTGIEEMEGIRKEARVLHAKLCLPLAVKRKPLGFLTLGNKFTGEPYTREDLEFSFSLANYISVAVASSLTLEKIKDLAAKDELTRLYNRRYSKEALQVEMDRCKRYQRPLSLAIFDIDHFKNINDTLGHPEGDKVLQAVARFLLSCSRTTDVVGRWGGEEFMAILPETSKDVAMTYCERVREGVEKQLGKKESEHFVYSGLTISGGMATFDAKKDTYDTIIDRSDKALYRAKEERNRIEIG